MEARSAGGRMILSPPTAEAPRSLGVPGMDRPLPLAARLRPRTATVPSLRHWTRSLTQDAWLAYRNDTRQRRRSLTGVVAIAFGIIALILAAGFIEWVYWAMREDTIGSRLGHIQIVRDGYRESGRADPFRFLLPESSPERDAVEHVPGVLAVAPRLTFSGLASRGESTLSFIGEGIDPEKEKPFSAAVVITHGEALSADDNLGIIVGQGLAANLGVKVGDQIVLLSNTTSGGIHAVEVHVR